ncbi:alpha/beta hydrolase [Rhodanobacter sp. FW510-R12]|nr:MULTISPECIES: alpha/beta fold hydrolase [Rhodanobacter]UJJ54725.1 alpha/beta hydrolase [Rhodanobacter thiooxydans]
MVDHRQPLWLLPGFLCDEDLWRDQLTGLADLAECTVADLGHADSIAALARQVLAAAPPRFALAGFSFGGYVAQEIARQAPPRIARLALLDTSFHADTPERIAQRLAANRTVSLPGKFRGMTEQLLPGFVAPPRLHDAALAQRINAMTLRQGREVFIRQNAMRREDGEAVLRSLTCPVMVLCGRLDVLTPPALHEAMAALMPQARLVVVEDSGHMSPMEQPAAVTRAMRDWLTA